MDLHARQRMFFFTSTGWMMWNFLASSLLMDVVPVLYDGNPAWPTPDLLWKMADDTGANLFGASPTYQAILEKAGIVPKDSFKLEKLETIVLAGSPVTAECQNWFYENVKADYLGALGQWRHRRVFGTGRRRRQPADLRRRDPGAAARALRPMPSTTRASAWSTRWANWC